MKKIFLSMSVFGMMASIYAQNSVQDEVIMGANYANDVYYILEDGQKSEQAMADWHIGFSTSSFSATIYSNSANTVVKFLPNGDSTNFADAIDTTGYADWDVAFNDAKDWEQGSFNQGPADYGWGVYEHPVIVGKTIALVEVDGQTLYKVNVVNKTSGVYTVQYALFDDNSSGNEVVIDGTQYANKKYIYFNLADGQVKDRELEGWDMVFTKFHDLYSMFGGTSMQTVTGILTHPKWEVASVHVGAGNQENDSDYSSAVWSTDRNVIGDKYKGLDESFAWGVTDSTVYYLKNEEGVIWKWYPTDFVGTSQGKTTFMKEKIEGSSGLNELATSFLDVYPNPATDLLTLVFDSKAQSVDVLVRNQVGQIVISKREMVNSGITKQQLDISHLDGGIYFVEVIQNGASAKSKIIKR